LFEIALFHPEFHRGGNHVRKKWRQIQIWPGTQGQDFTAEADSIIAQRAGNKKRAGKSSVS